MPVVFAPGGGMSIGTPIQQATKPTLRRRRSSGGGSSSSPPPPPPAPQSTVETPTPSAEQLFGTTAQREAQLEAFSTGGQSAFESKVTEARESLLTPPPSQVGLVPDEPRGSVTLGFFEGAVGSGKRFVSRFGSPMGERGGDILEPLRRTQPEKFAETAFLTPQFGTTQEGISSLSPITFGALQKDIEFERGAEIQKERTEFETIIGGRQAGLQEKVTSGELDVGVAQGLLDVDIAGANVEFQERQEQIFRDKPGISGLGTRKKSFAEDVVDVALLSTPLTSFIGAKASMKEDPLVVDIGQIERGAAIESAITSRPGLRTGVFIGGGVLGGAGALRSAGRKATEVRIESALEGVGKQTKGVQFGGGDIVGEFSSGFAKVEGAVGKSTRLSVTKRTPGGFITRGAQEDLVVAKEFFSDKPILFSEFKTFGGKGKLFPVRKDLTFGSGEIVSVPQRRFILSERRGEIITEFGKKDIQKDFFAGFSEREGEIITSVGGRPKVAAARFFADTGIKAIAPLKVSFESETFGTLKVLKGAGKDKGVTSFGRKFAGGTKTTFAQTFAPQVQLKPSTIKLPSPKTEIVSGGFGRGIKQKEIVGDLIGLPRSVGGEGLTDIQIRGRVKSPIIGTGVVSKGRLGGSIFTGTGVVSKGRLGGSIFTGTGVVSNVRLGESIFTSTRPKGLQSFLQPLPSREKLKDFQIIKPLQRQKLLQKQAEGLVEEQFTLFTPTPFRGSFGEGIGGFGFPFFRLPKGGGGRLGDALTGTLGKGFAPTFLQAKIAEEFGGIIGKGKLPKLDIVGTPGQIATEVKRRRVSKKTKLVPKKRKSISKGRR